MGWWWWSSALRGRAGVPHAAVSPGLMWCMSSCSCSLKMDIVSSSESNREEQESCQEEPGVPPHGHRCVQRYASWWPCVWSTLTTHGLYVFIDGGVTRIPANYLTLYNCKELE